MKKPIIGLNLDYEEKGGGFSAFPWHALRNNYFSIISNLGGIPVGLPSTHMNVDDYINLLDGLLLTGGNDYEPALYNQQVRSDTLKIMKQRSSFDLLLLKKALEKNIPILGICGGFQAINIEFGGTLYQHIPDEILTTLNHQSIQDPHVPVHSIIVQPHTQLSTLMGAVSEIEVNSFHHQALDAIGQGLRINALALDGIVEGIEHPDYKFCMGIQWHAEYQVTPYDTKLLQAFINSAASEIV